MAQPDYPEPKIRENDPQLPAWVQEMYADDPDVYKVDAGRNAWFSEHGRKHDVYTRWYKRWRRYVAPFVNADGRVRFPDAATRIQASSTEGLRSGAWEYLGPQRHFNVKYNAGDANVLISDHSNVYCVDRCASQPSVWYCGTESGGVYKSVDGAQSWSYVTRNLAVEDIGSIAVDPNNPNIALFASANELWRTSDGGTTWTITGGATFQALNFNSDVIRWHPTNSQRILLGTNQGLYRSEDGGLTFTQVSSGECRSIEFKPGNPDIVYALRYNSTTKIADFYKSTDSGLSFSIRSNGWFTVPAADAGLITSYGGKIAVTQANPERVYVLLVGESTSNAVLQLRGTIGVYSSTNAGETWTFPHGQMGMPYDQASHPNLMDFDGSSSDYNQIYYNTAFACSQIDETKLLIGGLNLWRSDNGGATYLPVGGYIGNLPLMHVDLQEFKVFRTSATTEEFWFSSDGGLNRSTDWLQTHESRTDGLCAVNFWGVDQGWNEDIIVGGRYHNGNAASNTAFGRGNFLSLGGGESPTGYVNYSPENKTYYSDINGIVVPDSMQQIAGRFGMNLDPNESYYDNASSRILFDAWYWNIAWAGKDNILYRSTDGGSTFGPHYTFGTTTTDNVLWIEQCASQPDVMVVQQVVANVSRLYRTTDGGNSFTQLTLPQSRRELYFSISHTNPNEMWIAYTAGTNGNKVYKSTDGGQTWLNITTSILNGTQIKAIAHQAGTLSGVYIAALRGAVYYRDADDSDWQVVGSQIPAASYPLRIMPYYKTGKLRLGTWNIGVWENDLFQSSQLIAGFSSNYRYFNCPGDTLWFTDRSVSSDNATLQWSFPGGIPSTSTARSPKVVYAASGNYSVTLIVQDGALSDTLTRTVFIQNLPAQNLPISEDLESGILAQGWSFYDDGNDGDQWSLGDLASNGGVYSLYFDNYYIDVQGKRDLIKSRQLAIPSQGGNLSLVFDVAYARYNSGYSDTLAVYISGDCGFTRQQVYLKGGIGLATAPDFTSSRWAPAADEWRTELVNNIAVQGSDEVMVIFENRGHYGQPIYLDNITITTVTDAKESKVEIGIQAWPNPAASFVVLEAQGNWSPREVKLRDMTGRLVLHQAYTNHLSLDGLRAGMYVLEVGDGQRSVTQKLLHHSE